jgi:hypothetical protein
MNLERPMGPAQEIFSTSAWPHVDHGTEHERFG